MSYTTHVRVVQSKPSAWYSIVEKTVWHFANGGTWSEDVDGEHTLTMGGSGTSGTLRFKNPQGDYFLVALGVHNFKRWCGIVVDMEPSATAMQIHPTYYYNHTTKQAATSDWTQQASSQKTNGKGVQVKVDYYKEVGTTYWVTITIS